MVEKNAAKKEIFIQHLAVGASVGRSARAAGIGNTTASKWRSDPEILAAISARQTELWLAAQSKLLGVTDLAIKTLVETMQPENPAHVRVGAARCVLERMNFWPTAYSLTQLDTGELRQIARGK